MRFARLSTVLVLTALCCFALPGTSWSAAEVVHKVSTFPPALSSYPAPQNSLISNLQARVQAEPFNLVATIIFFLAITHTFVAPVFLKLAHRLENRHQARLASRQDPAAPTEVSFWAEVFHFLGEIEAIFGIWVVPLLISLSLSKGWEVARDYIGHGLNFTEPLFVVVIMTIAASRPILDLAERLMGQVARLGNNTPGAWWLTILTIGPILGSLITEPAAMTISALLLARRFYRHAPSMRLCYATLGLLFVNVSVGGTLTHFAAPPVLMVAGRWGWDLNFMLTHFGWKAVTGIIAANLFYGTVFWKELRSLSLGARQRPEEGEGAGKPKPPVPSWIIIVHVLFLCWTVLNNHFPALFIGGFLFYIAFTRATEHHQRELSLRPALLVGFFLAGLVVHGGLQGWWIQPVLSSLGELPLFFGATTLTAFNDNAAITYLASLVPGFSEQMKYAVVSGAVVGGGLTVIANAPNPAGQSILSGFFPDGVSPAKLFLGALFPTIFVGAAFMLLRSF